MYWCPLLRDDNIGSRRYKMHRCKPPHADVALLLATPLKARQLNRLWVHSPLQPAAHFVTAFTLVCVNVPASGTRAVRSCSALQFGLWCNGIFTLSQELDHPTRVQPYVVHVGASLSFYVRQSSPPPTFVSDSAFSDPTGRSSNETNISSKSIRIPAFRNLNPCDLSRCKADFITQQRDARVMP